MRIAYLSTDFGIPIHGSKGASVHVRELSRALLSLGHEVRIISPRRGGAAPAGFGVPVHEVPLDIRDRTTCKLLRADPEAGEGVARETRSLLYTSSLPCRILPELHAFAPDVLYERYSLLGTAGGALATALRIPHLLEVNAPLSLEQAAHRQLAYKEVARQMERTVLRSADHLFAVSGELARWLVDEGADPASMTVLPNGVDVDRFDAGRKERENMRKALGIAGQFTVGFVGTLKAWHGTATFLRAASVLYARGIRPHILIVGDGPERAMLERLAMREGLADATTFTGAVPHERVPAYVAAMNCAVVPYDASEGFYFSPLKLFEYMAAGKAVVAADIGQISGCVRHGATGLLYPPGDEGALADAIATLMADPALLASLGRAAREYVGEHHTWLGNARSVVNTARRLTPALMGVA